MPQSYPTDGELRLADHFLEAAIEALRMARHFSAGSSDVLLHHMRLAGANLEITRELVAQNRERAKAEQCMTA